MILTTLLALGLATAQAACPAPVDVHHLSQSISMADGAFNDMDLDAFHAARAQSLAALGCLSEPLTTTQIAALYRMQAFGAFVDRDKAAGVLYLRALLAVAPAYILPEAVAPPGHPLRAWYDEALVRAPGPTAVVAPPQRGWVQVDGRTVEQRPTDRPYVFQVFNADGGVISTHLLAAGEAPPPYATPPAILAARNPHGAPTPPPTRPVQSVQPAVRINRPLLATAGVSALAAGGLYLAASQREAAFFDPSTPEAELASLRKQTNTLAGLSLGVGGVAGVAAASAFFVGTW